MPERSTIVAVDDEPANLELFRRVFVRTNYHLQAAESGARALELAQQHGADILLVDFSMPDMNGVEFLEQAQPLVPDAIAVMVTGYPELDAVIDAQKRGLVSNILAKPWRSEELMRVVEAALTQRDTRASLAKVIKPT